MLRREVGRRAMFVRLRCDILVDKHFNEFCGVHDYCWDFGSSLGHDVTCSVKP